MTVVQNGIAPGWIVAAVLLVVAVFRDVLIKALTNAVNAIWNLIYRRLAGSRLLRRRALSKYRRGLVETTERIAVPFRHNRPLILSDIYVALRVKSGQQDEALDVWDVLKRHPRLIVTGPPGAGKSMLLRHLAAVRIRRASGAVNRTRLPVLLELHRLARADDEGRSIEEHLVDAFERFGFPRAQKFVTTALDKGWLVLLFDGLDEVPSSERSEAAKRLVDFLAVHRNCPAIITCRTAVYRGELDEADSQIVELEPFEDQQIQEFLGSWSDSMPAGKSPAQLMAALREQPKLLAAARNPLLLTIVCHLYSDIPTYVLPNSRAEFYSQAAAILLDQWQRHLDQNRFEGSEKSTVLSGIALAMQETTAEMDHERRTATREEVFARVTEAMPNLGRDKDQAGPILREILERSGLLVSIDGGSRYAFAHLTFQEYFAAQALLNRPDDLIARFAEDPDSWREVVVLWCGLVPDSTGLIGRVREIDSEVALACVAEARSVESDLADSILAPIVDSVVAGKAEETMQRGLGAVAADVRPRGDAVLDALVAALDKATDAEKRASIATALSASNRVRAAEAIVGQLKDHPNLSASVVRLGDLAVPALSDAARNGSDPQICACLAAIGTPDAARALIPIMLSGGDLSTPAAWGVAKVIGNPVVRADMSQRGLPPGAERCRSSLDWIWEPFAEEGPLGIPHVVGKAAELIRATHEKRLAVAAPDPPIATALCAMSPNPLDHQLEDRAHRLSHLLFAAEEAAETASFELNKDGKVIAEVESSLPWLAPPGEPRPRRLGSRTVSIRTYRSLLAQVNTDHRADRRQPSADPVESESRIDSFLDALVDTLSFDGNWVRLVKSLPRPLRRAFFACLATGARADRESWPAVLATSPFRFGRSGGYLLVLTILATMASAAVVYSIALVIQDGMTDFVTSLLASLACLSILASIAYVRSESFPTSSFGGIDPDELMLSAFLGPIAGPILAYDAVSIRPWISSDLLVLATVGFLPGVVWLDSVALSEVMPSTSAIPVVAALLGICATMIIRGERRERALLTPLLGLFANA